MLSPHSHSVKAHNRDWGMAQSINGLYSLAACVRPSGDGRLLGCEGTDFVTRVALISVTFWCTDFIWPKHGVIAWVIILGRHLKL